MKSSITIKGAWAELYGAPQDVLEEHLTVLHPKRFFNTAFRQKRWDGKVRLFEGNRFPAGLTDRLISALTEDGYDVNVVCKQEREVLDLDRIANDFFVNLGPGHDQELWDHQVEAVRQLLSYPRGAAKMPTGSGKTACEALIARFLWEERGWRTLVVVPRKGLARQTAKVFDAMYEGDLEVGQCGDGKREVGIVTVGTAQTLIKFMPQKRRNRKTKQTQVIPPDPVLRQMVYEYEVLILDETHHASSETWYTIAMQSGALRRYGFSGTPLKKEEIADLRMVGATGEVVYTVHPKTLIEIGVSAGVKICIVVSDNASGPVLPTETELRTIEGRQIAVVKKLPYDEAYRRGVVENDAHNHSVIRAVEWFVDHGKRTLVLCRLKDHWLRLNELLDESGVEYLAIWGATDTDERDRAKDLLDKGKIDVVLATTILDEGEDIPGIDAIVLAEGVKAHTNAVQRVGRGMRVKRDRLNEVWVVDFAPTCHPTLVDHAAERAGAWDEEGYEVIVLEDWPKVGEEPEGELLPFLEWDLTAVTA
jgi:superfamily II DNA or RNA helicase